MYYEGMEPEKVKGKSLNFFGKTYEMILFFEFCDALFIDKENDQVNLYVSIAHNQKYWSSTFGLVPYMNALKKIIENDPNLTLTEEHDDPNHYGLEFHYLTNQTMFDDLFSEVKKRIASLDQQTEFSLQQTMKQEFRLDDIPFTLRKTKEKNQKKLRVEYWAINQKYWNGSLSLYETLERQHQIVSCMPDVTIIEFDIEYPEGMTLIYEKNMPLESTRKEAKAWLQTIQEDMIHLLAKKE